MDLVIDSSGFASFGEGLWAAAKHGGKGIRGWKKLHLGVDGDGGSVGQRLTDASVDDGNVGGDLVDGVPGKVRRSSATVATTATCVRRLVMWLRENRARVCRG